VGIVTESKNEEGIMVKVSVGILVHTVKKQAATEKASNPEDKNVDSCRCIIV